MQYFNYVKTFAKDHQVVATAGYSLFSRKTTSLMQTEEELI
jgi:hypothetical protein